MFTEEYLAQRRNQINGTDAGSIMGMNPFKSAHTLWEEKVGLRQEEDLSNNKFVKAGKYAENMLAQRFHEETGWGVIRAPFITKITHPNYPFIRGNLDALVYSEAGSEYRAILECKIASARSSKYWGAEDHEIPDNYRCQVAHYCNIIGVDLAYIAVQIDSWDFRIYQYQHDPAFGRILLEKELAFYECMQTMTPPERQQAIVTAEEIGKTAIANSDLVAACEELSGLAAQRSELREMITSYMADSEILLDGFGRQLATYKTSGPIKRFDVMGFKKDNLELYEAYTNVTAGSRRLCIRGERDE